MAIVSMLPLTGTPSTQGISHIPLTAGVSDEGTARNTCFLLDFFLTDKIEHDSGGVPAATDPLDPEDRYGRIWRIPKDKSQRNYYDDERQLDMRMADGTRVALYKGYGFNSGKGLDDTWGTSDDVSGLNQIYEYGVMVDVLETNIYLNAEAEENEGYITVREYGSNVELANTKGSSTPKKISNLLLKLDPSQDGTQIFQITVKNTADSRYGDYYLYVFRDRVNNAPLKFQTHITGAIELSDTDGAVEKVKARLFRKSKEMGTLTLWKALEAGLMDKTDKEGNTYTPVLQTDESYRQLFERAITPKGEKSIFGDEGTGLLTEVWCGYLKTEDIFVDLEGDRHGIVHIAPNEQNFNRPGNYMLVFSRDGYLSLMIDNLEVSYTYAEAEYEIGMRLTYSECPAYDSNGYRMLTGWPMDWLAGDFNLVTTESGEVVVGDGFNDAADKTQFLAFGAKLDEILQPVAERYLGEQTKCVLPDGFGTGLLANSSLDLSGVTVYLDEDWDGALSDGEAKSGVTWWLSDYENLSTKSDLEKYASQFESGTAPGRSCYLYASYSYNWTGLCDHYTTTVVHKVAQINVAGSEMPSHTAPTERQGEIVERTYEKMRASGGSFSDDVSPFTASLAAAQELNYSPLAFVLDFNGNGRLDAEDFQKSTNLNYTRACIINNNGRTFLDGYVLKAWDGAALRYPPQDGGTQETVNFYGTACSLRVINEA